MNEDKEELYKAADLAYTILQKNGKLSLDPSKIRYKLRQLYRGRPVESEFAALVLWSGRCQYIHKLDRDTFPKDSPYEIPDFLCFFDVHGKIIPVLVEVKASKNKTIKFTKKYYASLKAYADKLRLPILVAFKFTGFGRPLWALFELEKMATPTGTGRAYILEMMKHDLFGILLGNFHFQIRQGTTIAIRISKEKVNKDGSFVGKIEDLYWETYDGRRVESIRLLHLLFMLVEDDIKIEEYPNHIIEKFFKVTDEATIAYWALPLAADLTKHMAGGIIKWDRVIEEERFHFSLPDVEHAIEEAQKNNLAGPIIYTRPKDMPEFLKAYYNNIREFFSKVK